jgi:hypothetical protein
VDRYTVEHVARDPNLIRLAEAYLRDYTGSFGYLLEAKRNVLHNFRLNASVTKGVLNCMLGDPNVVDMPAPGNYRFDASQHVPRRGVDFSDPFGCDEEEEPPPPPRAVPLKVRWKMTHVVINHKVSRALHLLDPSTSVAMWRNEYDEIRWQIGLVCKSRATYFPPMHGKIFLLGYNQAQTTLKNECLTMSPRQFNGHEMKGGLVRDWRECKQCLMLSGNESILDGPRRTS